MTPEQIVAGARTVSHLADYFEELKQAKGDSSLFASTEEDAFPARHAREQFERFVIPVFTIVLLLLEAGFAYGIWRMHQAGTMPTIEKATLAV